MLEEWWAFSLEEMVEAPSRRRVRVCEQSALYGERNEQRTEETRVSPDGGVRRVCRDASRVQLHAQVWECYSVISY